MHTYLTVRQSCADGLAHRLYLIIYTKNTNRVGRTMCSSRRNVNNHRFIQVGSENLLWQIPELFSRTNCKLKKKRSGLRD